MIFFSNIIFCLSPRSRILFGWESVQEDLNKILFMSIGFSVIFLLLYSNEGKKFNVKLWLKLTEQLNIKATFNGNNNITER